MNDGGSNSRDLDTRLLRYRSRRHGEDAASLAIALLAEGRHSDAQEVVNEGLQNRSDDVQLLVLDGRARLASGDLLGAQATLLKAARFGPRIHGPFRWLGEVLLKRGDPGRAVKVLQRAQTVAPNDPDVRRLLERAVRLERIARDTVDDPSEIPPPIEEPEPPTTEVPLDEADEPDRTIIRSDLTEQLRGLITEREQNKPPTQRTRKATEDYLRSDEPALLASWDAASQSGIGSRGFDEEDDMPTNVVLAADLGLLTARTAGPSRSTELPEPVQPRPPKKASLGHSVRPSPVRSSAAQNKGPGRTRSGRGKISKTLAFGSEAPDTSQIRTALADAAAGKASALQAAPPQADPPQAAPPQAAPPQAAPPQAAPPQADPPRADPPQARPPQAGPPRGQAPKLTPVPLVEEPPTAPYRPAPLDASADHFDPFVPTPAGSPVQRPLAASAHEGDAGARVGGGSGENVDQVLDMLRGHGLFDPPTGEPAQWASKKGSKATGTRVGAWLGVAWVMAVLLSVGGYFGWQAYVERNHQLAAALVAQAQTEANLGDHASLVDAERHLREARDLNPHDSTGPTVLVFVHSQRALEGGAFDPGYLRPALARGERLEATPAYLNAGRAVIAAAEGSHDLARTEMTAALAALPEEPAILYLVGRLEQRLGGDDALAHLQAAAEGDPSLCAPRIALAEARYDEGQAESAMTALSEVLAVDREHLRALLWRSFLSSDSDEAEGALQSLLARTEDIEEHGAPTDHVIYELTRARLLRRLARNDEAGAAVDEALHAGASEPRLLALVANEGRRAGRLLRAEQAARTAVRGAPSNGEFRKLLAEIQLTRRNGRGALGTLEPLAGDDPDVLLMRTRAALFVGSAELVEVAVTALDGYLEGIEDASVELRAVRIVGHVRLGQAAQMLAEARALTAEAPGDPTAALALGETALRAFETELAIETLEQVLAVSPEDPEGHFLMGRARRQAADAEASETSLRRAIELSPDHVEARLTLGRLLLDAGKFAEADELYTSLSQSAGTTAGRGVAMAGRLGRIEALIGAGTLADAQVQFEGLPEEATETASGRLVATKLYLAQGRPGDALTAVRSLATAEHASATVIALYAQVLLAARQVEAAMENYERAVQRDAGSPEGLLGQMEMSVRAERERDALALVSRLERSFSRRIRPPSLHARFLYLQGRAHLLAGRSGEEAARRLLRQAAESPVAPPAAHFFLGEALSEDNSPAARDAYQHYLDADPEGPFAGRAQRALSTR